MTEKYYTAFARDQWNKNEWLTVRSPRWEEISHWIQKDDCISNYVPDDLKPEDMQMGRDRTGESYISMLLKKPVTGSAQIATTCVFHSRMAPLIVFSRELNPIHKEHLEVVLYDRGVNLWHHFFYAGKPSWKLLSFIELDLAVNEKHTLTAEMICTHKGKFLLMGCDGKTFGCRLADDWPETYYVGFTGCEGRNSFYDFSITPGRSTSEAMQERVSD